MACCTLVVFTVCIGICKIIENSTLMASNLFIYLFNMNISFASILILVLMALKILMEMHKWHIKHMRNDRRHVRMVQINAPNLIYKIIWIINAVEYAMRLQRRIYSFVLTIPVVYCIERVFVEVYKCIWTQVDDIPRIRTRQQSHSFSMALFCH